MRRSGSGRKWSRNRMKLTPISKSAQQGQQAMTQLLQSVESSLALAAHAEKWEWKEVESKQDEVNPYSQERPTGPASHDAVIAERREQLSARRACGEVGVEGSGVEPG